MCGVRPRQAVLPFQIQCMSIESSANLLPRICVALVSNWIASPPRAGFLCNGFRMDMGTGR